MWFLSWPPWENGVEVIFRMRRMVEPIYTTFGIRDWILEMHQHTGQIQEAIDSDQHDLAWRRIHEFQDWCLERIQAENYDRKSANRFLGVRHKFFARVLKKEGRHKEEFIHLIHEAASDDRELKYYPREMRKCFRRCGFETTRVDEALSLYEKSKGAADFMTIRAVITGWN